MPLKKLNLHKNEWNFPLKYFCYELRKVSGQCRLCYFQVAGINIVIYYAAKIISMAGQLTSHLDVRRSGQRKFPLYFCRSFSRRKNCSKKTVAHLAIRSLSFFSISCCGISNCPHEYTESVSQRNNDQARPVQFRTWLQFVHLRHRMWFLLQCRWCRPSCY